MNWIKDTIDYISRLFTWWVIVNPWESGIRILLGKKITVLSPGVWAKIPFLHSVRIQSIRLRVTSGALQTITSKDGITISIQGAIGFSIIDIKNVYETMDSPDMTIANIAMGEIAEVVSEMNIEELNSDVIQKKVSDKLNQTQYGLSFDYIKITNYAIVKTYRLMGDRHYIEGSFDMNKDVPPPK